MELERKLAILADAAKYDASCASSGTTKRNSRDGKGLGSSTGMGICHSYTPDGRCVSLLKILLTNYCVYDCLCCINRASSNVQRARFRRLFRRDALVDPDPGSMCALGWGGGPLQRRRAEIGSAEGGRDRSAVANLLLKHFQSGAGESARDAGGDAEEVLEEFARDGGDSVAPAGSTHAGQHNDESKRKQDRAI